ncbi:MAG: hypothetical protein MUE33_11315 [Cytophagaceae bacterium]|jgi:hypothetical protein|nr:hypothetical protein [Cytophagaceae bacterium]
MKKNIVILFLFIGPLLSNAQYQDQPISTYRPRFDISGMLGWMLAGRDIKNAALYSGAISYSIDDTKQLELSYNYLSSNQQAYVYDNTGATILASAPYAQGYVTGGMLKIFPLPNPDVMPYLTVGIGAMHRNFNYTGYQEQWSFATSISLGLKYLLNERIGLRFQARVQAPMNGVGLGVSIGTGGVNPSVGTYSNQMQLDFSGGLFIRL